METFIVIYGNIVQCFLTIAYIAALIYFIHDMILLLIPAIKCRKVKDCLKNDCPFRIGCRHKKLTELEKIPPWYRDSDKHKKKPSTIQRIYQWLKDFFF